MKTKMKPATPVRVQPVVRRYVWAGTVARSMMGTRKPWGDKLVKVADEDPLAWWCLTELIATGGPKIKAPNDQAETSAGRKRERQ